MMQKVNVFNGDITTSPDLLPRKIYRIQDELTIHLMAMKSSIRAMNAGMRSALAYAMSIHKTQGSEFSVVIYPLPIASPDAAVI